MTNNSNLINRALKTAAKYHDGQTRKGTDVPYITHPIEVSRILQKHGMNEDVIAAGLLHDILEDTEMTEDELKEKFGTRILKLVKGSF